LFRNEDEYSGEIERGLTPPLELNVCTKLCRKLNDRILRNKDEYLGVISRGLDPPPPTFIGLNIFKFCGGILNHRIL
jgi:hypothetical protein